MIVFKHEQYTDSFSVHGQRYTLLPHPTPKQLGALPSTLIAPVLAMYEHHKDRLQDPEYYEWALCMAFRHYNCRYRKETAPEIRAVTWAIQEVKRLCAGHAAGRPDNVGTYIRLDPQHYPEDMRPSVKEITSIGEGEPDADT